MQAENRAERAARRQQYLDSVEAYDLLGGISLLRLTWHGELAEGDRSTPVYASGWRPAATPLLRRQIAGVPLVELAVAIGLTVGPWLLPLDQRNGESGHGWLAAARPEMATATFR